MDIERMAARVVASMPRKAGTWALPETPWEVKKLRAFIAMLQSGHWPEESMTNHLHDLLGDDQLFDDLGFQRRQYLKKCANAVIIRIKALAAQDASDFTNPKVHENLVELAKSL